MAQLQEAAAGTEADVTETAPDNSQGNTETSQVEPPQGEETAEQALYGDDQPQEGEEGDEQQSDDDDDGDDTPEPVSTPASLKAEEKEQFAQLPQEAQRMLSEVLSRRDQEIQQGLQQARSAQQDAERAAADHAAQIQQQYADKFAGLVQAFQPTPPPLELARTNPAEYQYQKALFDEQNGQYQQLVGAIDGISNQSAQHFSAQQQEWQQAQVKQLLSIPEIADESTRAQTLSAITELGKEAGYTDEELAEVSAKDVMFLNKARAWKADAEKWRQHQRKRNERPRAAQGRFAAAPVGNGAPSQGASANNTLKALYPND